MSALLGRWPGALALYLLLLVASLLPLSLRPANTIAYVGDSLDSVYFLAWNAQQLFRDPLRLFDANILHPHPGAVLFDAHRILPSLLAAPILWTTSNPILACNLVTGAAYLFAAMGGRQLARVLGADALAAWSAGALYAFHTYQINESSRVNVLFHGFWPLMVAELCAYLVSGARKRAWRLASLALLQAYADNYNVLYGALLLALILAGTALVRPRLAARRLPGLALPVLAALLLFLPIIVAYARQAAVYGYTREPPVGIDVEHYFSTAPGNLAYGPLGARVTLQQRGPHFVGFVSLALAVAAFLAWSRGRGPEPAGALIPNRVVVPAAATLAVIFALLSLGRDVVVFGWHAGPGPYRLLHEYVPAFEYIRIPERLSLVTMLFVSLLVARGLVLVRSSAGPTAALALGLLVPLEHVSILPLHEQMPVGDEVPEVYRWLARNPVKALAEVPIHGEHLVRKESIEEYFASYHRRPIIHGYVSYPPLLSKLLRRAAAEFPSELSLQVFERVGVDTVVVHHGREGDPPLAAPIAAAVAGGRLIRAARFAGPSARVYAGSADEVYRIVPAPAAPAAPFPAGRRLRDPTWHYRAKEGSPAHAGDGDPDSAWTVPSRLDGDEFFEVTFGGRALRLAALVLPLDRRSAFPTRFRVAGRAADGSWFELARLDDAHILQLVDQLLAHPGHARLGFEVDEQELTGVSLLVAEGAHSYEGWRLGEVEVWTR